MSPAEYSLITIAEAVKNPAMILKAMQFSVDTQPTESTFLDHCSV
jgi:hypothetical protein